MLVLCYGITKSGSTLGFELVKGILASAGHRQDRLSDALLAPDVGQNYIAKPVDKAKINALMAEIGPDRTIAVKLHAGLERPLFPWIEGLQKSRQIQVFASYRDPRDICLSLVDAGARARAKPSKAAFGSIVDLESAIDSVEKQLPNFLTWASVRGAVRLDYPTVAFAPDAAIDMMEQALRVRCDRASVKKYAYDEAFTQKNKGNDGRYRRELTHDQKRLMREVFGPFLRNVYEPDDDAWYARYRENILSTLPRS